MKKKNPLSTFRKRLLISKVTSGAWHRALLQIAPTSRIEKLKKKIDF